MNETMNFGGDGGWWILLLFILLGGNGGFGGNNSLYPWMNNAENISTGLNNLSSQISTGFNGVEIAANGRQIADMNQIFALQSSMQNCCCENRLATSQTQNIIQSEGAATRLAIQNQTQAILDRMCEQELEQLRSANVSLQNQVNMLNLSASQTAQTAQLIADNTAQTQYLINKLTPATA
jgi:hypothetical protein